jgi:hypothetical protein
MEELADWCFQDGSANNGDHDIENQYATKPERSSHEQTLLLSEDQLPTNDAVKQAVRQAVLPSVLLSALCG